jgi:D-alanyl-D-alanine carboxypeptidase/D-alanyl-D-alanine-endopeptidase (penicillin-binding protein 4)
MSSLPIASVDGTLKKRMKDSAAAKRLRGKTGSIAGVSTLVGVVQSKGGELLAYAVLLNDQTAEPGSLKPWQNYLGQALSDFNRQSGAE